MGEGGLTILLGEPLTLRTHRLSVKVVVFNNSSLRMVKLAMLAEGYPEFQSDHDTVDFAGRAGPRPPVVTAGEAGRSGPVRRGRGTRPGSS